MYITFHVVTALEDNTIFDEVFSTDSAGNPLHRTLNKGDQLIRWYIPAAMIPQRTLNPDNGDITGNRLPVRIHYKVGLNEIRYRAGVPEEYIQAHSDGDDVYFYTNRHPGNVTLTFYQPHEFNPYYQPGRPGFSERGIRKNSNPTGTAPHVSQLRHTNISEGVLTELQWLGNNGRITIHLENIPEPPPESPLPPTEPPPTEPPERAPQTGTYHRLTPYAAILALGLCLTIGAIMIIVREMLFHKRKHREKHR